MAALLTVSCYLIFFKFLSNKLIRKFKKSIIKMANSRQKSISIYYSLVINPRRNQWKDSLDNGVFSSSMICNAGKDHMYCELHREIQHRKRYWPIVWFWILIRKRQVLAEVNLDCSLFPAWSELEKCSVLRWSRLPCFFSLEGLLC